MVTQALISPDIRNGNGHLKIVVLDQLAALRFNEDLHHFGRPSTLDVVILVRLSVGLLLRLLTLKIQVLLKLLRLLGRPEKVGTGARAYKVLSVSLWGESTSSGVLLGLLLLLLW
jgi:hypothetical protein